MTIIQAIILGALQGVAEFLPVSSSGHLVVARSLMELREIPQLFDVILHFATLLVVVFVFRRTVGRLIIVFFRFVSGKKRDEDRADLKLILTVLIASCFTAVLGLGIDTWIWGEGRKLFPFFSL